MIGRLLALLAWVTLALVGPAAQAQSDPIARGLAVQASTKAAYRFRGLPSICFTGDSNTQFAINNSGLIQSNTNGTRVNWLRWYLGNRFYYDQSLNFGLSSQTSAYWLASEVPAAIAAGCDIVDVHIGINDVGTGTPTLAQTIANVKAGIAQLNQAGIAVILASLPPYSTLTAARQQQSAELNRQFWLLSLDKGRNVRFLNLNPVWTDFSTGGALPGTQYSDNLHIAPVGGLAAAKAEAILLDPLLPAAADMYQANANETYDATLNPTGNILANGLMAGTGGTISFTSGGPATGQVATSWVGGFNGTVATTLTIALSKGANAVNSTIPAQVLTLSGTADGQAGKIDQNVALLPAGIVAGDRLYGQCRLSWTNAANIKAVNIRLNLTGATSPEAYDGLDFAPSGTQRLAVPTSFAAMSSGPATFTTPALTVPASMTAIRMRVEVTPLATGVATSITLAVEGCAVRKAGLGGRSGW